MLQSSNAGRRPPRAPPSLAPSPRLNPRARSSRCAFPLPCNLRVLCALCSRRVVGSRPSTVTIFRSDTAMGRCAPCRRRRCRRHLRHLRLRHPPPSCCETAVATPP
eukprot:1061672-Prymnesium_polylepis.1